MLFFNNFGWVDCLCRNFLWSIVLWWYLKHFYHTSIVCNHISSMVVRWSVFRYYLKVFFPFQKREISSMNRRKKFKNVFIWKIIMRFRIRLWQYWLSFGLMMYPWYNRFYVQIFNNWVYFFVWLVVGPSLSLC